VALYTISGGSLYISLCGRLSQIPSPMDFGAWHSSTLNSFTPSRNIIGYPFNHWATLAYRVAAAWPLFALSTKRLHDSGRSLTLAMLAALRYLSPTWPRSPPITASPLVDVCWRA
jgi:uncharacterized membrane protein YhaH (DUF805 family)